MTGCVKAESADVLAAKLLRTEGFITAEIRLRQAVARHKTWSVAANLRWDDGQFTPDDLE
jgi:hypothetical protein